MNQECECEFKCECECGKRSHSHLHVAREVAIAPKLAPGLEVVVDGLDVVRVPAHDHAGLLGWQPWTRKHTRQQSSVSSHTVNPVL